MNSIKIKSINDAFEVYRMLMSNNELCKSNSKILSNFSYQIDAYALATIINFFNRFPELAKNGELWKSNLLVIRMLALVTAEIVNFLNEIGHIDKNSFSETNNFEEIFNIRNKIHQFRYSDFKNNMINIDSAMGRSRDKRIPRLDVFLEYLTDEYGTSLFGTNIYQFHFGEAKEQATIDLMQQIIRIVEKQSFYPPSSFEIHKSEISPTYGWEVYCYTDIIKNTKFQNEKVIDRVLLAFDDLCCVSEFFKFTILTDKYLTEAPYLLFFLCKIVAIILDETFDNFKKYIDRSPNDNDGVIMKEIMEGIDNDFIDFCQIIRNNLHYQAQTTVKIGTPEELYHLLQSELGVVKLLLKRIHVALDINPSKLKLNYYRFLRWVQMPRDKNVLQHHTRLRSDF